MKKILGVVVFLLAIVVVPLTSQSTISLADVRPPAGNTVGDMLANKPNNFCLPKQPETANTINQQKAIIVTVKQEEQVESQIADAPYYGATTPALQKLIDQYNLQIAAYDTCILVPASN